MKLRGELSSEACLNIIVNNKGLLTLENIHAST